MGRTLAEKEEEIGRLSQTAAERLELIERQHTELEAIRKSSEYRLGYAALNPWQVLKKKFLSHEGSR